MWAQGQRRFNGIVGSGRTTALWAQGWRGSMASWAQEWHRVHSVEGSGRTMLLRAQERHRGVGNDDTDAPGRTRRRRGGSRGDSTMARAPGRSMMAWVPGKFLAGKFGSLTA
jgi:hypothetical protein